MLVYLCGGINGLSDTLAKDWRNYVKGRLGDAHCLDPMRRDYRGIESMHVGDIVSGDIEDITAATHILAMCQRPSWGTAMEIRIAWQLAKPVISVVGCDAIVSPWLAFHSASVHATLGEAVDRILAAQS